MSVETVNKSVFIEGDKTYFASKGAIDRYMTFDDYLDDDKVQELRVKMYSI